MSLLNTNSALNLLTKDDRKLKILAKSASSSIGLAFKKKKTVSKSVWKTDVKNCVKSASKICSDSV